MVQQVSVYEARYEARRLMNSSVLADCFLLALV